MSEKEKLLLYIEKLKEISLEKVENSNISAIKALKEAINYIEGDMIGY